MKVTYLAQPSFPQSGERVPAIDLPDDIYFRIVSGKGVVDDCYVSYFKDGMVWDVCRLSKAYARNPNKADVVASKLQGPLRNGMVEIY